jgi:hypothetical protein
MIQPAPLLPDGHEPAPPSLLAGRPAQSTDAVLDGEWGYEAADPALQARLWGEPQFHFNER